MNEKFYSFFRKYGLITVLIIAIFFRFYNLSITPPGLYPDEAINGNNASQALSTGDYKVFYPENNGREGLFINIQSFLLYIFKVHAPWVLRSESAFWGVITILGIYLLTQYIFRKRKYSHLVAFLSSFFTAISFWHVDFSRMGFRAIMAPAILVWGIYLLILSLELLKEQKINYKKIILMSVLGGSIYGLGMYSYIAYRATPILIIFIYLLYKWIYKIDFKKIFTSFAFYVIASLIVFSPLGIYFIKNPGDFFGRTSEISITSSASPLKDLSSNIIKTLGMFDFKGDSNWRHNISGSPEIYWFVGIFFIIGIFSLIPKIKSSAINLSEKQDESEESEKNKEFEFFWWILIFWMFMAMLPVVFSNESIPHALRSILMIPPSYMLAGLGALAFINYFQKKCSQEKIFYATLIIVGVFLIFQSYASYFIFWAQNPNVANAFSENYVQLGNQLNQMPQSIKKYVIVNADGVLVNGIPMPAETIMFITDTFTQEKQKEKNIYYLLPSQEKEINDKNAVVLYLEPK